MFRSLLSSLAVATVAAVAASASANANMGPPAPRTSVDCSKHSNKHNPACTKHSELNDDEVYESAYWNAKNGNYKAALAVVALASNKDDPRILRVTGFATRKLGDVDGAFPFYQKALALNANDTLTREYMGEAFLMKGDVASANAQLAEIEKRSGKTSDDYAKLAQAIADSSKLAQG
jgi:predicted Zn-dependent protease